jgi:hypothetical protein
MLDDAELSALDQFFGEQQGRFGTISFIDPWTQDTIAGCVLEQDSLDYEVAGEMRGSTSLVIVETRI